MIIGIVISEDQEECFLKHDYERFIDSLMIRYAVVIHEENNIYLGYVIPKTKLAEVTIADKVEERLTELGVINRSEIIDGAQWATFYYAKRNRLTLVTRRHNGITSSGLLHQTFEENEINEMLVDDLISGFYYDDLRLLLPLKIGENGIQVPAEVHLPHALV